MTRRERELEAMLRCSEEWVAHWERRARRPLPAESYEIPVPASYRRASR